LSKMHWQKRHHPINVENGHEQKKRRRIWQFSFFFSQNLFYPKFLLLLLLFINPIGGEEEAIFLIVFSFLDEFNLKQPRLICQCHSIKLNKQTVKCRMRASFPLPVKFAPRK
jgi:hypothetical protein